MELSPMDKMVIPGLFSPQEKTVIIPSDVRSAPDWEPSHDAEGESYS